MTDKPVIHASLIDARNVGQDKEIKLELRIPAEAATHFLEIFGWPTRAAPVSVVIVPLKAVTDVVMEATIDDDETPPVPVSDEEFKLKEPVSEDVRMEERSSFKRLPRMKQAGMLCREPEFWTFLTAKFPQMDHPIVNAAEAASAVRWWCQVDTRRDLDRKEGAASTLWDNLEAEYWATQHGMR